MCVLPGILKQAQQQEQGLGMQKDLPMHLKIILPPMFFAYR